MTFNAQQFTAVYADLGINTRDLGCVMLDSEPLPEFQINPDVLFYSDKSPFIQGQVSQTTPHATLLYGLMPGVKRSHVDTVLEGRTPDALYVEGVDHFTSPYSDENYYCIIAKLATGPAEEGEPSLLEAHQRLSILPHVNTFPEYKAHLTLAYVDASKVDEFELLKLKNSLRLLLNNAKLTVTNINYGDQIK